MFSHENVDDMEIIPIYGINPCQFIFINVWQLWLLLWNRLEMAVADSFTVMQLNAVNIDNPWNIWNQLRLIYSIYSSLTLLTEIIK